MMISALWSNSNYDDDKGTRANAIEEIENNFKNAAEVLRSPSHTEHEEDDENNPFMQAAKDGVARLEERMPKKPADENGTVEDAIDQHEDIDQ